jgi:N-sulfoglucosamine sulfohydrolase
MKHFRSEGLLVMNRRRLVLLLAVVAVLGSLPTTVPASSRANILFIVSEDNGPALGCYGAPVRTPCLDALARGGVQFTNAYVAQPGCSQSRAAFLTGLYPHQNGQIGLATWKYAMYSQDIPNVVTTLNKAGYRTGIIGKLHVNPEAAFPFEFRAIGGANFNRRKMNAYAENAAEFFGENDQPFYLQVNYPDAHWPFLKQVDGRPARPLTGDDVDALPYLGMNHPEMKQLTADYYNCMMRLDSYVADLLAALETSGKAENTVVVYIGDHGAALLRGKRTCYEGGVKIPMIIRWPGGQAGQTREELVSTLDLFPTFCEIAGVKPPDDLPGRSLRAIAHGEMPNWREYLFTEYHVHSNHNPWPQRTVRSARYKLIWNPLAGRVNPRYAHSMNTRPKAGEKALLASVIPEAKRAYVIMKTPPEYELYDLQNDPYEFTNLADDPAYAEPLAKLTKQLRDWQKETGDALKDPENAEKLFDMIQAAGLTRKELPYDEFMDTQIRKEEE